MCVVLEFEAIDPISQSRSRRNVTVGYNSRETVTLPNELLLLLSEHKDKELTWRIPKEARGAAENPFTPAAKAVAATASMENFILR